MRSLADDPLPSTTGSASSRPPFSTVEDCLDQIHADGPEQLSSDSLRQPILWFVTQQRTLEAISARWLAELDRREQQAPPDPSASCVAWLQDSLHLSNSAAYSQLRSARKLEQLPS